MALKQNHHTCKGTNGQLLIKTEPQAVEQIQLHVFILRPLIVCGYLEGSLPEVSHGPSGTYTVSPKRTEAEDNFEWDHEITRVLKN